MERVKRIHGCISKMRHAAICSIQTEEPDQVLTGSLQRKSAAGHTAVVLEPRKSHRFEDVPRPLGKQESATDVTHGCQFTS